MRSGMGRISRPVELPPESLRGAPQPDRTSEFALLQSRLSPPEVCQETWRWGVSMASTTTIAMDHCMAAKARRTTHRGSTGKKLYAVREKTGSLRTSRLINAPTRRTCAASPRRRNRLRPRKRNSIDWSASSRRRLPGGIRSW